MATEANQIKWYFSIKQAIMTLDEHNREACTRLYDAIRFQYRQSPGSSGNHQAWYGGYLDHVSEMINIGMVMYYALNEKRKLPFTHVDIILVALLHDIEKPWRFCSDEELAKGSKADRAQFRDQIIAQYNIRLTNEQRNAIKYVEGEGPDYTNGQRIMGPLAAFCHAADTLSARMWHDRPLINEESWGQREEY